MAHVHRLAISAVLLIAALQKSASFSPAHHVPTANVFTSSTSTPETVTPATVTSSSSSSSSYHLYHAPRTLTKSSILQLSPDDQQELETNNAQVKNRSLLKRVKPVALSIFTVISSFITTVSPSFASAPVTPIRQFKPQDQKKIALDKMKQEQSRMQMQEQMTHQLKCEEIEETEGKEARKAYEAEYEQKKIKEGETRVLKRKELLYGLVQQGICPFMDLEGERQVYEFDNGIDLAKVPTTPQQKEFMNLRRNPKLVERRAKERFIIKCIVDDLIAKGEDPLEFLQNNKDKTMEIFGLSEKKLDAVAARYKGIIESQGTLSGVVAETPFNVAAAIGVLSPPGPADVKASKAAAKLEAAKAKAKKKAEEKAAKEAKKSESLRLKAEAKAEKEAKKAEAKASKEAAKAEAARVKAEAKVEADALDTEVSEAGEKDAGIATGAGDSEIDQAGELSVISNEDDVSSSDQNAMKASSLPIAPIAGVVGVAGGGILFKNIQDKNAAAEEERQKQFRLIMGMGDDGSKEEEDDGEEDDFLGSETFLKAPKEEPKVAPSPQSTSLEAPKKRRRGLASVFSKKGSNRETDLSNLIAPGATAPEFSTLLAKLLSFGAAGRFPLIKAMPGGMPMEEFNLDKAKELLIESRQSNSITDEISAEAFACVVNCMIIDIIDLASSSLGEEKKNTVTVDALNVVMDFMDHAASLFDAVADGVVITPVTYGGNLGKSKLEKMFTIYASSLMTSLDGKVTQDRIDTLQQVFNINDKRAEGLIQKGMMKNLMNMMKNPEAMGDMGGMEGMEGLSEMMAAMGGEGGMPGFDPNGEISPEELKQSVAMMKELVNSGSVSKEELDLVRQQFQEVYGSDITDLIKAADEGGEDELGEDGKELLDLFKTILKED